MTDDKDTKVSGCVINQNHFFFLSGKSIHFDFSRELHIFKSNEFEFELSALQTMEMPLDGARYD